MIRYKIGQNVIVNPKWYNLPDREGVIVSIESIEEGYCVYGVKLKNEDLKYFFDSDLEKPFKWKDLIWTVIMFVCIVLWGVWLINFAGELAD